MFINNNLMYLDYIYYLPRSHFEVECLAASIVYPVPSYQRPLSRYSPLFCC